MFPNIVKIAFRNFLRQKTFTLINVVGLAVGLCSCIAIFTIVNYEFSFDSFHRDKNRIYRVMVDVTEGTGDKIHFARSPIPLSTQMREKIPGLDEVATVVPYDAKINVAIAGKATQQFDSRLTDTHFTTTVIAEPQWFALFTHTWLAGDRMHALDAPGSTVLTETRARQYFGDLAFSEMIGKPVIYDSLIATVTGIIKDWPATTDLGFTDFISWSTLTTSFLKTKIKTDSWEQREMRAWTFVKLSNQTQVEVANKQLVNLLAATSSERSTLSPWLQPLADMHFDANVIENVIRTAHRPTLLGIMIIGAFILLLAVINFINLSTAQSLQRNKEAGIRKLLGSRRASLIAQYFIETFLLTLIAVLLALCFVQPVFNVFHHFLPGDINFNLLNLSTLSFLLILTLTVTILSGWYPARVLSSAPPAFSLRNTGFNNDNKWLLRKGLIVFQFTVSLVFITGVIVMRTQLNFIRNKDLVFSSSAIVMLNSPAGDSLSKLSLIENSIKKLHHVTGTALQWVPPLIDNGRSREIKFLPTDLKETSVVQVAGDEKFIPLYNIQLLAGRNLQPSDTMKEIIINETLCRLMGYTQPADVIGKPIYWSDMPYPIVGVVKDFHTRSLHEAISPLCLVHRKDRERTLAIKYATGNAQTLLSQFEKIWKDTYPGKNFSYTFYDDTISKLYQKDQQAATLTNVSMAITIFISCFGLFGLALFTAQKRAKEISIRKILGATVPQISLMLCKDFIKLVLIGLLIAIPFAWYFSNEWLTNFRYRIHVSWWMFALAGFIVVAITLLTIGFQALKASFMNPVKNLRSE